MGMKVLITGAGGFFGKALVRAFAQGGDEVVAADTGPAAEFTSRPGSGDEVAYVQIDVADPASLTQERIGTVDAIVSAAALTPSLEEMTAEPDKLVSVNLVGTLNLLEVARRQKCSKFLFVSSAGVYDQFTETTLREPDADGGFSLYGSAKLAAEIMLWRYGRMYDMDVGAIRPTSMYGPEEQFRPTRPFVTAVKQLVDAALAGTPVRILGETDRCDWIYVDDVAETAQRFFAGGMGERVFNLSSDAPARFETVVSAAQTAAGLVVDPDAETVVDGSPDRPTVISNERARSELGHAPRSLEDGIRAYVDEVSP
jgi:nucleoside-diphosphate-sugar epimerase